MQRPERLFGFVALCASVGTLVCCAFPALLVLLGLGASVATILVGVPSLVTLSQHKGWVFLAAGLILLASTWYVHAVGPALRERRGTCVDADSNACRDTDRLSRALLWIAVSCYVAGAAVAYLLPIVFAMSER